MTVYEWQPPKDHSRVFGIIIIFLSVGAAFFVTPILVPSVPFHGVFQFIGILAIVASIYVMTRCIAKSFAYAIIEDDGKLDFTVTELTNGARRATTVCRISLSGITEVRSFNMRDKRDNLLGKEFEAEARKDGRKCYIYSTELIASRVCIILCEECGEPLLIEFPYDERMFSLLNSGKEE